MDTGNFSNSKLLQPNGPTNLCPVMSCNLVAKIQAFQKRGDRIIKTKINVNDI